MSQILFRRALLEDNLFKKVTVIENEVHFELNEDCNNLSKFDNFMKNLLETRPIAFTAHFYFATKHFTKLKLKEPEKGFSNDEIVEILKAIAKKRPERTYKEKVLQNQQMKEQSEQVKNILMANRKRLPWRKLLGNGELIESLSITGNSVILLLKEPYNEQKHHSKIRTMLKLLFQENESLKKRYIRVINGKSKKEVALKLKNTECLDSKVLLDELVAATGSFKKVNFSKDLREGILIKSIQKQSKVFIITFQDDYNNPHAIKRINKSYNLLHDKTPVFQKVFSKAKVEKGCFKIELNEAYLALTEEEILKILTTRELPVLKEKRVLIEDLPDFLRVPSLDFLPMYYSLSISGSYPFLDEFLDDSLSENNDNMNKLMQSP